MPVDGTLADEGATDGEATHSTPTFGLEVDYTARIESALCARMTITEMAPEMYHVETDGGDYHVDLRERVCECPDCRYRDCTCKHYYRCYLLDEYGIGEYSLLKDEPYT